MPDIVLPDIFNYSTQFGESNLDNPLPWDTIQSASYDKLNLVQPYLAELKTRSDARVATNQDFTYVRQDIEQYKKTEAEHSATLNEQEAIKERRDESIKNHAREEERENRPDPHIKIYELTVKDSSDPGLPPAENWLGQTNGVQTVVSSDTNSISKKIAPPFDPMTDESEHILQDYISLLQKSGNLTVNP
jgi:carboxyl-terminal processing protease